MTELSFLLELMFNHKLSKSTRQLIKNRIAEIQLPVIAAEMEKAKTYSIVEKGGLPNPKPLLTPTMPENIAQTPAAQEALNTRQAMINAAMTRKVMPGSDHAPKSHGKL
jgi:hypothetical protein